MVEEILQQFKSLFKKIIMPNTIIQQSLFTLLLYILILEGQGVQNTNKQCI